MSLDYRTIVMYGWKVSGRDKVNALIQELEKYDEDYYDHMEKVMVEDTMCGKYFYFGVKVVNQDAATDNTETVVTDELMKEKIKIWEDYLKEYFKFPEILKNINIDVDLNKPQLYVFQHIS